MRISDCSSDVCSSDLVINGTAARDIEEQECRDDRAEYLREDIKRNVARVETPACPPADGDCGVEVTARNMADRIGHGHDGQTDSERNAQHSYADIGQGNRKSVREGKRVEGGVGLGGSGI